MRQILLNSSGAVVARMPRPALQPGRVLVKSHYSLISAGTELAGLSLGAPSSEQAADLATRSAEAVKLLKKALRDPQKATRRVVALARGHVARLTPARPPAPVELITVGELTWAKCSSASIEAKPDGSLHLVRDAVPNAYQAIASPVQVPAGHAPAVRLRGEVHGSPLLVGFLDRDRSSWVGHVLVGPGAVDDVFVFPPGEPAVSLVLANGERPAAAQAHLDEVVVDLLAPGPDGTSASDLQDQGWNVGYSLAGEVVAVGEGVSDLRPGDLVACAGAGFANHADYVSVPRQLVCPLPKGAGTKVGAMTTVGAIALQGVRRAAPQLGERVCVIGLGLIGQVTSRLLLANSCVVIGHDIDASRVERAKAGGMQAGSADVGALRRLVLEATSGQGADQTIVVAGSRSNDTINLAMDLTRRKGRVVVVGDVGLGVDRAAFYRKEIDLLISTSYGPGRYDPQYEEHGVDYPYGYVRWTLNRNMAAFLELAASGRTDFASLIDLVTPVREAPAAYSALRGPEPRPLGVLIDYTDQLSRDDRPSAEERTSVTLGGHAQAKAGKARYALVGAGAFATSMLVPRFKEDGRFSLAAVVSSDAARGGNLARSERAEVLTSDLSDVLRREDITLVVIATRHSSHAEAVVAATRAGKNVFVEKPLALTWEQLDLVVEERESRSDPPLLMVGYNRRFSPALRILADELADRTSPLVVNYRVNAGYVGLDHWIQGPDGGGRNLGEACHMYDTFRFLARAPAAAISASSIRPVPGVYLATDNFSATINYEDGSVANLMYTSLGPSGGLPKERIEVFCGGQAYLVDDFQRLERCGDGAVLWSGNVDKGHSAEVRRLGDALLGPAPAPVPFHELLEASVVSLSVQDLLMEGTG